MKTTESQESSEDLNDYMYFDQLVEQLSEKLGVSKGSLIHLFEHTSVDIKQNKVFKKIKSRMSFFKNEKWKIDAELVDNFCIIHGKEGGSYKIGTTSVKHTNPNTNQESTSMVPVIYAIDGKSYEDDLIHEFLQYVRIIGGRIYRNY